MILFLLENWFLIFLTHIARFKTDNRYHLNHTKILRTVIDIKISFKILLCKFKNLLSLKKKIIPRIIVKD